MKKRLLILTASLLLVSMMVVAAPGAETGSTESTGLIGGGTGKVVVYETPAAFESATGNKITSYQEAPMLAAEVNSGRLVAVNQRVPSEPLVISPPQRIGDYGGTLKRVQRGRGDLDDLLDLFYEQPLNYSADMLEINPNVLYGWEVTNGGKTYTFKLRKGMKWSDGQPFTADDFLFFFENVAMNEELRPAGVNQYKTRGVMGKLTKTGDFAIRMDFQDPHGILLESMCRWRPVPYMPAHYLKQFHPDFTAKATVDAAVKAAGYNSWIELFTAEYEYWSNPNTPTVTAWQVINDVSEPVHRLERNPFYWKVDTAGNQLPYIDKVDRELIPDREAMLLKTIAGETDYMRGDRLGFVENYSTVKQYEADGGYKTYESNWSQCFGTVYFNFGHEDPVLREIFLDKRFRVAMSVAIDREEVNDLIYNGAFEIAQVSPPTGPPYYGERDMFKVATEHDPAQANRLLDEMGLKKGSDGWRMRSDGKRLELTCIIIPYGLSEEKGEMYKEYWENVGVKITLKSMAMNQATQIARANQHELYIRAYSPGGFRPIITALRNQVVPIGPYWEVNQKWFLWLDTDGKEGMEPPAPVKRLRELAGLFIAEPDALKRQAIEEEIHKIYMDELYIISAVRAPRIAFFFPIANRLKNVYIPIPLELYPASPSIWFIEE